MNETDITIVETDLASRQAGARARALVEKHGLAGERVIIHLGAVLSISESYADELFGVLVARHGLEWFANHVGFRDASPTSLRAIIEAIRNRLQSQSPGNPDIALLAAKKALDARRHSRA